MTHIAVPPILTDIPARHVLTLLMALTVTSCGGASKEASETIGVGDAFAAKALSVCATAQKAKHEWSSFPVADFDPSRPDASKLPQVGAWLQTQVVPTFGAWLDDLTALGVPPAGRAAWADVLSLVGRIEHLNRVQVQAAKDVETDEFAGATRALQGLQPTFERATAAARVGKCAEVHAG